TNLSLQAANDLRQEIEKELRRTGLMNKVGLQVIGPVSNDESALQWGDRVGAEIVVWGRMVAGQPEAIVPRWTDTTHWVTPAIISPTEIMDASMKGDTVLVSDRVAVPHNVHASALVGQAAIYLGEQNVAITQFERALDAVGEIQGDTSVLRSVWLRCRGQAHWSAGQPSLARDDFIASVHLHPDVHTYTAQGNLRLAENDLPGAIGNYRAALAVDPYGASPYIGLGYAYASQGDLAAAIGQLEQAKRLRLDFAPIYYGLGMLYRDHGDVYLAREAFDHCIVLAEENAEIIAAANKELRMLGVIPVSPTPLPTDVQTIATALPPSSGATISAPTGPTETFSTPNSYVVQSNDNLTTIAARFGITVESIVKANNLRNANAIYVGQELIIPAE
ncbi:MAG: LysM peptidoglycan-binding domain-containing protein, partial [Chloroflexota bacterium]